MEKDGDKKLHAAVTEKIQKRAEQEFESASVKRRMKFQRVGKRRTANG